MSSCILGFPSTNLSNLNFGAKRVDILHSQYGIKTSTQWIPLKYSGLTLSGCSGKVRSVSCSPTSTTEATENVENGSEDTKYSGPTSKLIPNSSEVESLLTQICDTSSIAEFELKVGGFQLHVTRNLNGKPATPPVFNPAPAAEASGSDGPDSNGSVTMPSLAISKPISSSGSIQTLLDKAADEGLVILKSPRVGYFRRSRTIKGKRAPPSCKEKQIVKEAQVLCFIEQLGGEVPIESDTSGEVIRILKDDGEPVGYGDALIAVLPSFPGIKKLPV